MKLTYVKFLILRRIVQSAILLLFVAANRWQWNILTGDYSAALLFGKVPITDPLLFLQLWASAATITTDLLVGAILVLVLYALIGGRTFCAWVCPYNPVSDAVIYLQKKLGLGGQAKFPASTRYVILAMTIILSAILGVAAFDSLSPLGMWHRGLIYGVGANLLIVTAVVLLDFSVFSNGWCGHICPLGAFFSLVGRLSFLRIRHKHDQCSQCKKCFAVCPEKQVLHIVGKTSGYINSGACTRCGRCVEICPDNALSFGISSKL
jgi:ferredoxin-type protein NapH